MNSFTPSVGALTKLVAASSSTSAAATQICTAYEQAAMLSNGTTIALYAAIGSSSVQAAMPTTAVPATGMCIPPGRFRPIGVPGGNNVWLSAVTSAGSAAPGLFVTPGFGP